MSKYQIEPLVLGKFQNYEKSWLLYNVCWGEKMEVPVLAFLLRSNDKVFLVDTGFDHEAAGRHEEGYKIKKEEKDIVQQLRELGVEPEAVNGIIQTHLHWDMCGNSHLFPNAEIYVQQKEVQYAIQPYECQFEEYETAHLGYSYPWVKNLDRFIFVNGDLELCPGLQLLAFPGHTPGFQGVLADTEKGKCLIAGDSVPLYENWLGIGNGKKLPSAIHVNTADCLKSFELAENRADLLLAGRDEKAARSLCLDLKKGGEPYVHL